MHFKHCALSSFLMFLLFHSRDKILTGNKGRMQFGVLLNFQISIRITHLDESFGKSADGRLAQSFVTLILDDRIDLSSITNLQNKGVTASVSCESPKKRQTEVCPILADCILVSCKCHV